MRKNGKRNSLLAVGTSQVSSMCLCLDPCAKNDGDHCAKPLHMDVSESAHKGRKEHIQPEKATRIC
jgi:hypothetical protein